MIELSDSTRRLVIFVAIVLGGSILLIFDIPVLYLMMGVIGIAIILLVITGTIILSELIRDIKYWLKNRPKKPKKEKPPKEKGKEKAKGAGIFSSLSGKIKMPSISLPAIKLPSRSEKPRDEKKKGREEKKGKEKKAAQKTEKAGDEEEVMEEPGSGAEKGKADDATFDADLLEGLDLDDSLDIDAELASVNPEFDNIRTPYGEGEVMPEIPSDSDVKKMDIATHDEEEEIILDDDQGPDEIDAIYSSTIDIGSDSGGDVISNLEGGDTISSSDLSTYSSSEDTPYMYGQEEDSGGEEQFELSQMKGGGDDDLIASLKADIEALKKKDDDVLLRDLKDVHVTAEELAEELQEIMTIINRRIKRR